MDKAKIGSEEEKKDKPTITTVGLKENIKNANAKVEEKTEKKAEETKDTKADDDDEVQLEDPSEDIKEDDEKETNQANDSNATKLAGAKLS